jgi:aspartate ammonia-lyase
MPGKVNPVIPEVVNQVAFSVAGADLTVTMAVEGGQLQLNAFEPIIAHSIFQSITWMRRAMRTLRVNCVDGITANRERLGAMVGSSVGVVTALTPFGESCLSTSSRVMSPASTTRSPTLRWVSSAVLASAADAA